jgi:tetratricopeptide (TPR) repeat protein
VAEGGGPAQPETKSRETREALAHVLVARSLCSYAVGELDASLASADEAYSLASKDALDKVAAEALRGQGAVHWQRGQYEAAEEAFRRRLLMVQALGLKKEERSTLGFLALVAKSRGRYEEALARYSTSLQALRADGKEGENLYLFNNMGNLLRLLGRTDEALALLREGLKISRDRGMANDETFLLTNVALAHETRGELAEAAHWAEQARDMARTHGEPMIEAAARLACARVAARRERDRRGLADVHASLAIAERLNSMPVRVQCLATAGFVLAAAGDVRFGLGLVHWAMAHPDFTRSEREDAARHLAALDLATAPHDVQPAERSVEDLIALLPLA